MIIPPDQLEKAVGAAKVDVMLHAPTRQDELHRIRTIVHIPHPRHHRSQPDRRQHQRHHTRPGTIRPSVAGILQRAAIGMKRPIGAHQQQRFTDRLGHQQAVKRITVMERQLLERQQVGEVKG